MADTKMSKYYFPTNGLSRKEAVIQGKKYRITVLTPSLLRLEYSEAGIFENRATQSVVNRDFEVPVYQVRMEKRTQEETPGEKRVSGGYEKKEGGLVFEEFLVLETSALKLTYNLQAFSPEGLRIQVKELPEAIWHYGQELYDLKGTYRTLDGVDGDFAVFQDKTLELGHGIISREGFSVIDDSKSMALTEEGWVEPRKECNDLYFFGYGHRYLEALNDFYRLCGRTPLLPRYALGNWWSRYYRYTDAEYKKLMTRFEQEQLPFSVAVIDMDWHLVEDVDPKYGSGWTGYTWNKKFFPDPEGFMAWLHDKNMKVTLNVHPADGIRAFEEIYPKVAETMGIDPVSEKTVEFDPADPHFMEVYFQVLSHELESQGVDFWWVDWQQGTESKMEGLDPLWILNHFHYLDSAWKGTRQLTFSRYAGVGSHRYPVGFSGDTAITWASLRYQPYFTNTASNIGYGWWSHDIGGHMWGLRDDELMARWVQYGVFSPINRLHSSNNPFSGKEPWKYDAATRQVMNKYLRLRHGMIPYLYTMNRKANKENLPLIQPMYYKEPEREEAYQVPNEYYFGTELLVSPVTTPVDKVSRAGKVQTWLPEGIWADFFTGVIYKGGRMLTLWRDIENIPVLMKAGAIVPMKDMEDYDNSVENPKAMEIKIFPAANGSFTLWEDAGDTCEDKEENWVATKFEVVVGMCDVSNDSGNDNSVCLDTAVKNENVFIIHAAKGNLSVIPEARSWKLVFCATAFSQPVVKVNHEEIPAEVSYDEALRKLTVQIPETDVTAEVEVNFPDGLIIAQNPVKEQCYEILERAQMDYGLKEKIWNIIRQSPEDMAVQLAELEMNPAVRGCLMEMLTSD